MVNARRAALHERGAPLRRGGARASTAARSTGRRPGENVPSLDDHRPALPQPLRLRRPATAAAVPRPLVQGTASVVRADVARPSWPRRSACRRRRCERTVDRFNGFAKTGNDEDFRRGDSGYDRYYGDPTVKPNPCLPAIDQGPFYAVKIVPGDLGTKGGLRHRRARPRAARRRLGHRRACTPRATSARR